MNDTGAWVRRGIAATLLIAALVCVALAIRPPAGAAKSSAGAALTTPLWSPRRIPQAVVDAVGQQRLQAQLSGSVDGEEACYSVAAANVGSVATANETSPLIPASTQKLLTAAAALQVLGPDHQLETRAVASAPVKDGAIDRLWLVGGGDPLLVTPEGLARRDTEPRWRGLPARSLAELADAVVAAGVRKIPGGVIGDDHHYDAERSVAAWPASYVAEGHAGAIGALIVNSGFAGNAGEGAASSDPALDAAVQLSRLLAERGVQVGPSSRGQAPDDATAVAAVRSSLTDVLTSNLAASDNTASEMIVKEIATADGGQGTTARGLTMMRGALGALDIPLDGVTAVDGSGLAREDHATCAALLAVLGLPDEDDRYAALRAGLAVAGERGTLVQAFLGTPLVGKLTAKTGTLDGVTGLAGYVATAADLQFALLVNGQFGESGGLARREQMASIIGRYPDSPPAGELVPAPSPPAPSPAASAASRLAPDPSGGEGSFP